MTLLAQTITYPKFLDQDHLKLSLLFIMLIRKSQKQASCFENFEIFINQSRFNSLFL